MSFLREHRISEDEARFVAGRCRLRRRHSQAGAWRQRGHRVAHSSRNARTTTRLPEWLCDFAKRLSRQSTVSGVRVAAIKRERRIGPHAQVSRSLYLEFQRADEIWTQALPRTPESESHLKLWLKNLASYWALPEAKQTVEFDHIEFGPAALGYLLHEGLGHRLESDDFTSPIEWPRPWSKDLGFDVFDRGGHREWLGHTPFDDGGVPAEEVRLLCGKTGTQEFLSAKTGNRRAIGFSHHALIRQRCLEVEVRREIPPPTKASALCIDAIGAAEIAGEKITLVSARQCLRNRRGQLFRLPALQVMTSPQIVARLRMFGTREIHHPAGGCAKNGQRELPISFHAPSAWFPTGTDLKIELKDRS